MTQTASVTVVSSVDSLSIAGRCIPAGSRGEPVAGDFFDVFPAADGRLLITLGDVAGHGLGAAEAMSQLRADARAFARVAPRPVDILGQLDLIQSQCDTDQIATLWVGIYDPPTGRLEYSSAGHPPLVLAEPGRPARLLAEASAPPLGTGFVSEHAVVDEVHIPVGAVLVGYSDGLVERPDRDLEDQIELLRGIVEREANAGAGAAEVKLADLVHAVLRELVPYPATARDDVCVLLLRRES
jgi:serine phosphatase RsbU (regulator of sigma subunit)